MFKAIHTVSSVKKLILVLTGAIFISELLIMSLFAVLPPIPLGVEALLDAVILSLLCAPMLYLLVFRPMAMHILEQKQDQVQLRESEQHFRGMFDNAAEGILLISMDGYVIDVNVEACRLYSYSHDEFVGKHVGEYSPDYHLKLFSPAFAAIQSGKNYQVEVSDVREDGTLLQVEMHISPYCHQGKSVMLCFAHDITERRQAEAEVQTSEARYRAVSQSATDAIFSVNSTGEIINWNLGAEAIFGYTEAEAMKMPLTALMPQRCREQHRRGFSCAVALGAPPTVGRMVELAGMHKSGKEFPIEVSWSFWDVPEGRFVTEVIRDVSKRKKAEAEIVKSHGDLQKAYTELQQLQVQLLQSEKMASVGQLAAGVAHEINNPVGYVYSNMGSLQKYLDDLFKIVAAYESIEPLLESNQEAMAEIRAVKASVDLDFLKEDVNALMSESREGLTRVKTIVQNLKDFSHSGSGEEWQQADLQHGLDSTLNVVWNEIKYKATLNKEYGQLPEVECLPSQLNQVFMNLIINAAHAIKEKGIITIRTGAEGDDVWIEITDTGCGISPENLNKIFEPFFTTKPVGKGTGLGLSVSYGIIKTHHGNIKVMSNLDQGTTFRITLPVTQPDVTQE